MLVLVHNYQSQIRLENVDQNKDNVCSWKPGVCKMTKWNIGPRERQIGTRTRRKHCLTWNEWGTGRLIGKCALTHTYWWENTEENT